MFASRYADPELLDCKPKSELSKAEDSASHDSSSPMVAGVALLPALLHTPATDSNGSFGVSTQPDSNAAKSPAPARNRSRRRVIWKGKTCIIALPEDVNRGMKGAAPRPLSPSAVEARVMASGDPGADAEGVRIMPGPRSREEYPDADLMLSERLEQGCIVRMPNQKQWESYVNFLTEQKLRALGVSVGVDEPPAALVRRTSSPYHNLHLPLLPPHSSVSSTHAKSFSAAQPLPLAVGKLPRGAGVASPIPPFGIPQAMIHMQRQSMTGPPHHQMSQPFRRLHTQPTWDPLDYLDQGRLSQEMSPVLPTQIQAPGPFLARPSSRIAGTAERPAFVDENSAISWASQREEYVEAQLSEHPDESLASRPQSTLDRVTEAQEPEDNLLTTAHPTSQQHSEFEHPVPRGHGYNISANLERGLEKQVEGLRRGEYSNPTEGGGGNAGKNVTGPMSILGKPVTEVQQYGQAYDWALLAHHSPLNNIDAHGDTPAAACAPNAARSPSQSTKLNHAPKFSLSKLNVGAKEFTFHTNLAYPTNLVASGDGLTVAAGTDRAAQNALHQTHGTNISTASFKANVTSGDIPELPILTASTTDSGFNFSAPFVNHDNQHPNNLGPSTPSLVSDSRIFGKVDLSDVVRQPKKSKAVPIVKPIVEQADKEDETGHITQGDWRSKRIRHAIAREDDVPQFAISQHFPSDVEQGETGEAERRKPQDSVLETKSNNNGRGSPPIENPAPRISKDQGSRAPAAPEVGVRANEVMESGLALQPASNDSNDGGLHASRSSLSATAKPFQFKGPPAATSSFDDQRNTKPAVLTNKSTLDTRPTDIGFSQSMSRSPTSKFWPSDDPPPETTPGLYMQLPYPDSDEIDYSSLVQPTYNEIDAVMKHLNDDDEELGIERTDAPWLKDVPIPVPETSIEPHLTGRRRETSIGSRNPSSTLNSANAPTIQPSSPYGDYDPLNEHVPTLPHSGHVHCLNSPGDLPASDWDDVISFTEAEKLQPRSQFAGVRVHDVIDGLLQERLKPLEKDLQLIQGSIASLTTRDGSRANQGSVSVEVADSDADDEDDTAEALAHQHRSLRVQLKDKKLRSCIDEVVSTYERTILADFRADLLSDLREAVTDLRVSPLTGDSGKLELAVEHEKSLRKSAEEREAESQRRLRHAEQELCTLRESHGDQAQKLHAFNEERRAAQERMAKFESESIELHEKISALSAESAALEGTLDEYRISSSDWRREIDEAKEEREALKQSVRAWKSQAEENLRVRDITRAKLERVQGEMALAAGQIADEKASWAARELEQRMMYQVVSCKLEAEVGRRQNLEVEVQRLESQTREHLRVNATLEQVQAEKARMEESIESLKQGKIELQRTAEALQREVDEAKASARAEVQHTRTLGTAEVDAAKAQGSLLRAQLESHVAKLQGQLEATMIDADMVKSKYRILLDDSTDMRESAIRDAEDARSTALQEQKERYERHLAELRMEHTRSLNFTLEDKQRSEGHLNEKLSLSEAKLEYFQDKVRYLEEKLDVAKAAAEAAVTVSHDVPPPTSSISKTRDQVSPQALRESILVLQEQLHEREMRIESLESELLEADSEAPDTVKERETEIAWLRELLGLRIDDLSDLVNTLSHPVYDRGAVRNAAIRIRANLQMEQQEKERWGAGGSQMLPGLASLSNFASPKAAQLAAAFGNWRKGREGSLSNAAYMSIAGTQGTPSKVAGAGQAFLSGLMTPPRSNLRRSPQPDAVPIPPRSTALARPKPPASVASSRVENQSASPGTPPLMRTASYDQDADERAYASNGFYDEEESNVNANSTENSGFEPFSPVPAE